MFFKHCVVLFYSINLGNVYMTLINSYEIERNEVDTATDLSEIPAETIKLPKTTIKNNSHTKPNVISDRPETSEPDLQALPKPGSVAPLQLDLSGSEESESSTYPKPDLSSIPEPDPSNASPEEEATTKLPPKNGRGLKEQAAHVVYQIRDLYYNARNQLRSFLGLEKKGPILEESLVWGKRP